MQLTNAQRDALRVRYDRSADGCATFAEFIERAVPVFMADGACAVAWCGMVLCVETDGHCHT